MTVKDDLNRLIVPSGKTGSLPEVKIRPSINKRTVTKRKTTSESSSGGGIKSPLSEVSRITTEHILYDDFNVWSTTERVVTQMVMKDSAGNKVVFNYSDPNIL